jgi:hypothetical protein
MESRDLKSYKPMRTLIFNREEMKGKKRKEKKRERKGIPIFEMLIPSIITLPPANSTRRKKAITRLDFPAPIHN